MFYSFKKLVLLDLDLQGEPRSQRVVGHIVVDLPGVGWWTL